MSKPIPITEHRTGERRADWHTPADCYKLLDAQNAMEGINKRLDDGSARMGRIEDKIAENHENANTDRKRLESSVADIKAVQASIVEASARQEAKQDANNADTAELLEIVRMGRGFFRGVAAVGKWFRKIVLWVLPLATAIIAFWYTITGHGPGK